MDARSVRLAVVLTVIAVACVGCGTSETATGATGAAGTSACEDAVAAAAAVGGAADSVTDLDPAVMACGSLSEFAAAAAKYPNTLDGADAMEFVTDRCAHEPSLSRAAICEAISAAATPPPWPAKFGERFCIAITEQSIFTEDLQALQDAAQSGDLDALELSANALNADTETLDLALSQAPSWKPAKAVVKAWRKALAAFGPAFTDLEKGARRANAKLVKRGIKELNLAAELLGKATPKVTSFIADTGFTCP